MVILHKEIGKLNAIPMTFFTELEQMILNIIWTHKRPWLLWWLKGFPGGSDDKESDCNSGNPGSIPGLGRYPGEGKGYPLQYSDQENSMDCMEWGSKGSNTAERLSLSWRRKWQSTPVLLPGKSHGQRSLVGYSPWDRKELDMTEWLTHKTSPQQTSYSIMKSWKHFL